MKLRTIHSKRTLVKSIFSDSSSGIHHVDTQQLDDFTQRLPAWLSKQEFDSFTLLFTGGAPESYPPPHGYLFLLGFSTDPIDTHGTLDGLDEYCSDEFSFGIISYDLKNSFEVLESMNEEIFDFPTLDFRKHETILTCSFDGQLKIKRNVRGIDIEKTVVDVLNTNPLSVLSGSGEKVSFEEDVSDEDYLQNVEEIRAEIKSGNVYELNYCRNFQARCEMNPFLFFQESMVQNPSPFSCFIRASGQYIIGNSMERYLHKRGSQVTAQPIKGTLANSNKRHQEERDALYESAKERAENLMIVDLMRNDLNKSSETNTVKVDELFGIYTFPTVHQMISTVSAHMPPNIGLEQLLKDTFPMGSMTGAPKLRSMELIERFEHFKRGVYAGTVGYVAENGDFDFNVVIRTLLYDPVKGVVNIPVGSAITYDSNPEEELNECHVKVEKLRSLLGICLEH